MSQAQVTAEHMTHFEPLIRRLAAERAWNLVNNRWDADLFDDLSQECRVTILRVLPDLHPARGNVAAFVTVCCVNAMKKFLAKWFRLKGTRRVGHDQMAWASSLVVSFDGVEELDQRPLLTDHQPQREAEARAQISLALSQARLTPPEVAALRANLSRDLSKAEKVDLHKARRKLNRALAAGSIPTPSNGRKCSEVTRAKISAALLGRKLSQETRQRLSAAHIGVGLGSKRSEATKQLMRQRALGRRHSEETKQLLREKALARKQKAAPAGISG